MTEHGEESGRAGLAEVLKRALADALGCLRFYSRLPVPALPWDGDPHRIPDFARMPRMLPVAGAVIGSVGALAMAGGLALGLGPLVSAGLAVLALALVTGALHEDGLADVADGFGGGTSRERRLEIMRDSRIGAFGATALAMGLVLRVAALAELAERTTPIAVAAAIVLGAAVSRTAGLLMLRLAPPARRDGASHAVGQPTARTVGIACALTGALALFCAALLPASGIALGLALAGLTAWGFSRLAGRLVGGHTGDVAGAIQQVAEVAGYLALLIALRP